MLDWTLREEKEEKGKKEAFIHTDRQIDIGPRWISAPAPALREINIVRRFRWGVCRGPYRQTDRYAIRIAPSTPLSRGAEVGWLFQVPSIPAVDSRWMEIIIRIIPLPGEAGSITYGVGSITYNAHPATAIYRSYILYPYIHHSQSVALTHRRPNPATCG